MVLTLGAGQLNTRVNQQIVAANGYGQLSL